MTRDDRRGRAGEWRPDASCSVVDGAGGADGTLDLSRRSLLAATGAGVLGSAVASESAGADDGDYHLKTRPTIWTESDRENARTNVGRYEWAEDRRDSAVDNAGTYRSRYGPDLDSLWGLITGQKVPRGGGQASEREILGGASDPGTDRLWKIETTVDDPHGEGNLVVPTNDFGAYRESGLDDRGLFDPDLADDDLLVNEEHPEMGEGWGVDDGWGWTDTDDDLGGGAGNRWNFVAYYNHWFTWRPGGIRRTIVALTDAYLLTGDAEYAVAGLVMLDRIADVYPAMSIHDYQQGEHGFWNNHGGRQTGRIIGGSWETNLVRNLLPAYDAFFPALEDETVANEVVDFLSGKVEEYPGLSGKDSIAAIRENVEENFLQEMLPAAKNSDLVPERGQRPAVALSARIQDDTREGGYTREALEWLFQPGGEVFEGDQWDEEPENWVTTGGELLVPVVDDADRDGYWHEAAPGYNRIQMASIRQVAETLQGYDGFDGADLYDHPKFREALSINTDLLLLDEHTPEIGDEHSPSGAEWSQTAIEDGYAVTGDPIYAQLWHYGNDYSTAGIRGSIFDPDPEGLADDIQAIIDAEGPLDLPSRNLAGYGFAALRDGENNTVVDYDDERLGFLSMEIAERSTDVVRFEDDGLIQFEAEEGGESITFAFEVEEAGAYELNFRRFLATSYGIYEISLNGELVETHDFYDPESAFRETWAPLAESVDLEAGTNTITFENVGKHDESTNYKFAVGTLQLLDAGAQTSRDAVEEYGNAKRAFWLYYGRNGIDGGGTTHNHGDALNLGVAAHELELSPDLGYPEQTGDWPKHDWTKGTISHNTVTVDESRQDDHWVGTPRHFEGENDRVNLIDVEARHAYEQCETYRRTVVSVTVDEGHSYAVDFFGVTGGDDHVFSFHGQAGEASAEGVDLTRQDGGTYAGEDVPKPERGEDSDYNREVGSGFNYLTNVSRDDDPDDRVTIDFDVEDHWGHRSDDAEDVHMRLTSVGDLGEVALADGHPPQLGDNPETLPYALFRRQGEGIESTFVSTIEHYEGERVVESIEGVDVAGGEGHAVRVELANGRTDYVVRSSPEEGTLTVDDEFRFEGFVGLYSLREGEPVYAYVHDGTLIEPLDGEPLLAESAGQIRGSVEEFTRAMSLENEVSIRVSGNADDLDRHAGFLYVDNDDSNPWRGEPDPAESIAERDQRGRGNGAYPIEGVETSGNTVTFDVGERTFTRDFVDPDELEEGGYEYVIGEGDDVRIPLTASWSPGADRPPVEEVLEVRQEHWLEDREYVLEIVGDDVWAADWELGDGTRASGHYLRHTYEEDRTYEVTLVATIAGEEYTYTETIDVDGGPSDGDDGPPAEEVYDVRREEWLEDREYVLEIVGDDVWAADWAFGDGSSGSGHYLRHTYEEPGSYDLTLTATIGGEEYVYTDTVDVE